MLELYLYHPQGSSVPSAAECSLYAHILEYLFSPLYAKPSHYHVSEWIACPQSPVTARVKTILDVLESYLVDTRAPRGNPAFLAHFLTAVRAYRQNCSDLSPLPCHPVPANLSEEIYS